MNVNEVVMECKIMSKPEVQATYGLDTIYECLVSCPRTSGKEDIFKVQYSKGIGVLDLDEGDFISVAGELRTAKVYMESENRRFLCVYINANEISKIDEPKKYQNKIILKGFPVVKDATFRKSFDDRDIDITEVVIEVPRNKCKTSYIHCTLWNNLARLASTLKKGDIIELEGRLQSHVSKNGHTLVEVSVSSVDKL